jgi:tetratricopeptide (TPR) repeat protein
MLQQGLALQNLGENEKALVAFDRAITLMPPNPARGFLWLHKARTYLALNDQASARQALDNTIKEPGAGPEFFFLRGTLFSILGQYDQALADFEETTTLNPHLIQAWDQKAGLLIRLQRFGEALESLERAIELAEDGPGKTMLRIGKGAVLLKQGDFDAALTALDEASRLDEKAIGNLQLLEIKTQALLGLGRRAEVDNLFQSAARDPQVAADPIFQNLWANALLLAGKNTEAIKMFEQLAAREPEDANAPAWLSYGNALSVLGRFRPAVDALNRARELDPSLEASPLYLAPQMLALSGIGSYEESLTTAQSLAELDPTNGVPHMFSGIALAGLEKNQEALTELRVAVKLAPNSATPNIYESGAQIQMGWVLAKLEQPEEALAAFKRAEELAKEVGNVLNRISSLVGQSTVISKRSEKEPAAQMEASRTDALKLANEAAQLSEGLPAGPLPALAWWSKGNILTTLERHEEALIAYQRAKQCDATGTRILLSMGKAYATLQDHENAARAFAEAAAAAETPEEKSEAWLGRGLNLRLLERYEEAIEAGRNAMAAGDETEAILQLLGRAYSALGRNQASLQTYRRGWGLGKPNRRSADCALGISSALLALGRNQESSDFLERAEKETEFSGELYYNYGIALCRLKKLGSAARAFRKAGKMGVDNANEAADKLDGGGGGNRTWLDFWFGGSAWTRRALGVFLLLLLVVALLPSFLKSDALKFAPWLDMTKDWKVMLIPIVFLSTFLLLPVLKRVSVKGMEFDISQPEPELARLDAARDLKAFVERSSTTIPQITSTFGAPNIGLAVGLSPTTKQSL